LPAFATSFAKASAVKESYDWKNWLQVAGWPSATAYYKLPTAFCQLPIAF
jgi:hypothetical protein